MHNVSRKASIPTIDFLSEPCETKTTPKIARKGRALEKIHQLPISAIRKDRYTTQKNPLGTFEEDISGKGPRRELTRANPGT